MVNIELSKQEYNLEDGIRTLTTIFKKGYLAKQGGFDQHYFSMVTTGYKFGGFANFPQRVVDSINKVAEDAGRRLIVLRITDDNPLAQIKELGKWVNIQRLFLDEMGWTYGKQKGRISQKNATCYGKFSKEELNELNDALNRWALKAVTLHFSTPVQYNIDNKVETTAAVQDPCKKID